jgi:5'-deoxynucleotidase YfbR-like HD superfamily hydrolase
MTRKNKTVLNAELNQIRRMLEQSYTNGRIIEELKIQPKTLQRHLNRIYEIDRKLWEEIARESLESRAVKIMDALQLCMDTCTEIAQDKGQDPKARIEAGVKGVEANIMWYNILENGPKPNPKALPV